jgi:hypothetical protein
VQSQILNPFAYNVLDATDEQLIEWSDSIMMDSIYFNRLSYFSAKLSAGGAIETCRAVVSRKVKNAIAVIRPPGHHAEINKTMGFCLFNNVCIASRVCQNDFGPECRKILILDWYVWSDLNFGVTLTGEIVGMYIMVGNDLLSKPAEMADMGRKWWPTNVLQRPKHSLHLYTCPYGRKILPFWQRG